MREAAAAAYSRLMHACNEVGFPRHCASRTLICCLSAGLAAAAGPADASSFVVGHPHPPLVLPPVRGETPISIDGFRGTKVLIVYFATWSPEGREAMIRWREQTKAAVADKKVVLVGVMLDHHCDRCRLFAQWQEIDAPLLHDPLDLAGVRKVPTVVGLDEAGIVRVINPNPSEIGKVFLDKPERRPPKDTRTAVEKLPDPKYTRRMAGEARDAGGWRSHGETLNLSGDPDLFPEAIEAYAQAIQLEPKDARAHFGLGVAYLARYECGHRQPGDFQSAIDAWRAACGHEPKNGVYRSRIQQYGLRHEKRAEMYGWIGTARKEIQGRGQTPTPLTVEPAEIECAKPQKRFKVLKEPQGRSFSGEPDAANLVEFEGVVVPALSKKRPDYVQLLLIFRPNQSRWSGGADGPPLAVQLEPPEGVTLSRRLVELIGDDEDTETGVRTLYVEARLPKQVKEPIVIKGRAFYRLDSGGGEAGWRCRDIEIKIPPR